MIKLDIPDPSDKCIVADWIELNIAIEKTAIPKAAVISKLESSLGDESGDAFISSVWDELELRMLLYGDHPPFVVVGLEVVPNLIWEENPEYLMCIILSLVGNPVNPTPTGKLFERLSKEAAKNYISGSALVFGHPSRLTVAELCKHTFEKLKSELPQNYNDRGVDVIAWKPFADGRGNQIIILMQCAGGKNWTKKTGDVVMRAWKEKYITFGCTPVRGFSTVVIISKSEEFEEISFETDLLLDRTRIYRNTKNYELEFNLRLEIQEWCNYRLQEILN
jgi:hypothetical protein